MSNSANPDPYITRGIEYLLVIAFLPLLVWFKRLLRAPQPAARPAAEPALAALGRGSERWFRIRPEAWYHPGHTWALPGANGAVRIGMDDFAQKLLGRPARIELPEVGERVVQGADAWKVRIDSKAISQLSPVDGVVTARNQAVLDSPDLVNQDPYGDGWLLEVRPSRLNPDLKTLLNGDLARAWMDTTLGTLHRRMQVDPGLALQDGGVPVEGMARALSPEAWDEIAREFFLCR